MKHGPSIHDCAITERFVLILDLPVTFSMAALIGGHSFPYRWNPSHQARIGLLPRHVDAAEDDGWLLGFVVDMDQNTTALAVIDSRGFDAEPVAMIGIPHRVPAGFHGNWITTQR